MLRWQGEPDKAYKVQDRKRGNLTGRPGTSMALSMSLLKEDLKRRLLSIPRKPKWQRRNEHILHNKQPAGSGTGFREALEETQSHLKQNNTFVLGQLSLPALTIFFRDLHQNAHLTFLLAMLYTPTQFCPVFSQDTASLDDEVPNTFSRKKPD